MTDPADDRDPLRAPPARPLWEEKGGTREQVIIDFDDTGMPPDEGDPE